MRIGLRDTNTMPPSFSHGIRAVFASSLNTCSPSSFSPEACDFSCALTSRTPASCATAINRYAQFSKELMDLGVGTTRVKLKVLNAIVLPVPVTMMYQLCTLKQPSKTSFHNKSVLKDVLAVVSDQNIALCQNERLTPFKGRIATGLDSSVVKPTKSQSVVGRFAVFQLTGFHNQDYTGGGL